MGWCNSPSFFCATSETEWNGIKALLQEVSIPDHPFNHFMLDTSKYSTRHRITAKSSFTNLLEVFVDNFIGMTNNSSRDHFHHFLRKMLIGIHSALTPPEVSGYQGQYPISDKNLNQEEGKWETKNRFWAG